MCRAALRPLLLCPHLSSFLLLVPTVSVTYRDSQDGLQTIKYKQLKPFGLAKDNEYQRKEMWEKLKGMLRTQTPIDGHSIREDQLASGVKAYLRRNEKVRSIGTLLEGEHQLECEEHLTIILLFDAGTVIQCQDV
eukprot:GHVU01214973.1.p2 GENE.GHVU01214973.1~~GHVU01214973.1.p2  ORF type:complete len:135 (-),score=1.28 GHVU01214973.1:308-712(-)